MARRIFRSLLTAFLTVVLIGAISRVVGAAVTVTAATGGGAISADTTSATGGTGAFTALTGPTLAEAAAGEIGTGTIVLNVPAGFEFRTSVNPTVTVNSGNIAIVFTSVTTSAITYTVNTASSVASNITFGSIAVRPTAGTPLASGNITRSGTSTISGVTGSTNFGTLTEVVGAASRLAFTTQPSSPNTAGTTFGTQPAVTIQDQFGNTRTADTTSITLAIGTNPPGNGVLQVTTNPLAATAGVATFSGVRIDQAGTGYTLTASATGLTGATSAAFNITHAAASQLAFTTQPSNGTAGTALGTQPAVTVRDQFGNTVSTGGGATTSITLAIGTNPPGNGVLQVTTNPLAATAGVATFAGVRIDQAGTGYTLTASATGLTGATSAAFNITHAAASQLAFTTQPSNGTAGTALGTQPAVTVRDQFGNTVSTGGGATTSITLAIGTNPPGNGVLQVTTNPLAATAGVATFGGVRIDQAGTGYTVTASATGLTGATSGAFNITHAAASQLAFTTQPSNGTGGTALATQPAVTVRDQFGNTVSTGGGATTAVTLAIGTNPSGGTLSVTTNPLNAVAGVATFSGVRINLAGTGYTLTAAATGLTGATSAAFNITTGAAASISATSGNGQTGQVTNALAPFVVTVRDAGGNPVAGTVVTWTVPAGRGTLSATATATNASGQASTTFVPHTETSTVRATVTGLTGSPVAFTVSAEGSSPPQPAASPTPAPSPQSTPSQTPDTTPAPPPTPATRVPQVPLAQNLPGVSTGPDIRIPELARAAQPGTDVIAEVGRAVDVALGSVGATVAQDAATGILVVRTAQGQEFSLMPLDLASTGGTSLVRQAAPRIDLDPASGIIQITTAGGLIVKAMPAPRNLSDFLTRVAPSGVTGIEVGMGRLVLKNVDPTIEYSARMAAEVAPATRAPGVFVNADGTATVVYADRQQQAVYPALANYAEFRDAALAAPDVQSVSVSLDGVVTVQTTSGQLRARPDFAVRAGIIMPRETSVLPDLNGSFLVRYRDGREQVLRPIR